MQENDLPALLQFWETHSGWGSLTEEQWRLWYEQSPFGKDVIVVAEDAHGSIAAQMVFSRQRVSVDGEVIAAVRASAPILRADLRAGSLRRVDHPIVQLMFEGFAQARTLGAELVYARPAPSWLGFFTMLKKVAPWSPTAADYGVRGVSANQCVERSHDAPAIMVASELVVDERFSDTELDALWARACASLPLTCGVVRDSAFVRFRNGGYRTLGVRDALGELVAYVAVDVKTRLIVDYLGATASILESALRVALASVLVESPGVLKAIDTPLLSAFWASEGFVPSDYTFLLTCDWLVPHRDLSLIGADRWYLGALD